MPILALIGINTAGGGPQATGRRDRGPVDTDGNQAMLNALELKFPSARRQRCVKHKMGNVLSYVPERQREQVEPELKAIFYQESREKADQELGVL